MTFLGQSDFKIDGEPVSGFYSSKARALLVYLAVTAVPHSRSALAGLLWADMPEADARTNLRQVIANLRRLLGPFLIISRQEVAFDSESTYWLDVAAFQEGLVAATQDPTSGEYATSLTRLREVVELYQGEFLTGFYVRDAPLFEEWMLERRREYNEQVLHALRRLVDSCIQQDDYENGIIYANRLLALDPWQEEAHRQLMRLLAWTGRRGAALRQFDLCKEALAEELGIQPSEATVRLYEQIKRGELESAPARADHILPSGRVTFLFTDMVSSSTLWESFPQIMPDTLARHDALLREAAAAHHGYVFKQVGDGLCVAFQEATDALLAAVESQKALLAESWGEVGPLRVRMAIHSGKVEMRDGDYFGMVVNQTARLTAVAGGGQILLSRAAQALADKKDSAGVNWLDLGQRSFIGLRQPLHFYQAVVPGLPSRFTSVKESMPGGLPKRATAFVGRQTELAEITRLLETDRLVTLNGPGGIGKTRLALAAAQSQLDKHRDGVTFVPLLSLQAASAVVPAIANALGLVLLDGRSQREQLLQFLESRQMLLLLDNFEHMLVNEILELVAAMLTAAPELKILVTSREVLHLSEEHVYQVYGLPVGSDEADKPAEDELQADDSAVELFLHRARRVRPDLDQVTDEEVNLIHQICRLVEGMPLAIELAAVQTRLLSLAEIAAELNSPLDVLDTSTHGISDRHSSMRLVLEASWRSLDDRQKDIFARLSVIRGGFTRQAAREVAGATLSDMAVLLDKSLMRRESDGRFVRHALIRTYAAERLAEDPARQTRAHKRHFDYYARILREAIAQWQITNEETSISALAPDTDNLLAAWRWVVDQGDWAEVSAYLDDLRQFLRLRHRLPETIELLEEVLRAGSAAEPVAGREILAHWERLLGESCTWLSQFELGRVHFNQAISLHDRPVPEGSTAMLLGLLKQLAVQGLHRLLPGSFVGRRQRQQAAIRDAFTAYEKLGFMAAVENSSLLAIYCYFKALNLAEDSGQPLLMAHAYAFTGLTFGLVPLRRIAESYLARSRALALEDSSISVQERTFGMNAFYYAGVGQSGEALDSCQRALSAAIELGQHWDEGIYLVTLHLLARFKGDYDLAFTYADQISDTTRRNGDIGFEAAALYWKALLKVHQGDADSAISLLNESASAPAEFMNLFDWIVLRSALAQAYLRQGRKELARLEADKVADLITQMDRPSNVVAYDGYAGVTAVYLALWDESSAGDQGRALPSAARLAVSDLRTFAKIFPIAGPRAWLHQGQYDWLNGKRHKAYKAWAKSLALAQELEMPYVEGLTHLEIGRRLPEADRTQEGWGAGEHLQRACEIFAELGTSYDLSRAQAELERRI